jgi:membrane protein required for colicin V production
MDKLPLNPVDLAIIGIVLISGVLAFFRGFVREVLAIVGWVGAAFATLYLFAPVAPLARRYLSPPLLADGITGAVLFIGTLLVLSIVSHAIAARVRTSALSAFDRSLGFLFGIARGAVIVAIAYMLVAWTVPTADQPQMLHQAKVLPLVSWAGDLLVGLLPPDARLRVRDAVGTAGARAKDAAAAARTINQLTEPGGDASAKPDSPGESGYKGGERRALDNLIRNYQVTGNERQMLENMLQNHQVTAEQRQMLENMLRNHQMSGDERRLLENMMRGQQGQR